MGCPRSGTTLVQAFLAAHPRVVSFPESHAFVRLRPPTRWHGWLDLAGADAPGHLRRFFAEIGHPELAAGIGRSRRVRRLARCFVGGLDEVARREGASAWVEKTPAHLRHLSFIERVAPSSRFVHVVRNGVDVVASLYAVTHAHPEIWGGPRDLDACIARWIESMEITERHVGRPRHAVVGYEELTRDPETILRSLGEFLGVGYHPDMIDERSSVAGDLVRGDETKWKSRAAEPLARREGETAGRVLAGEERRRVEAEIASASAAFTLRTSIPPCPDP